MNRSSKKKGRRLKKNIYLPPNYALKHHYQTFLFISLHNQHAIKYSFLMKYIYLLLVFCALSFTAIAQPGNVGIGTVSPNNRAILDLVSPTKGLLVPRTDTLTVGPLGLPERGMLIYDPPKNKFFFWTGLRWLSIPDDDWIIVGNDQYSGVPGNVGIGVTTPLAKFHNNGTVRFQNLPNSLTTNDVVVRDPLTGELFFRTLGSDVWDGDNQTLSIPAINQLAISGGNTVTVDTDPTNDYNTNVSYDPNTGILTVTDPGGTLTTNINTANQVNPGLGMSGNIAAGVITLDVNAINGITATADSIKLGGPLNQQTTITNGNNNLDINLNGTGRFEVQNNGAPLLHVANSNGGQVGIGTNAAGMTANAIFQVNSQAKGIMLPKLTGVQRDAIPVVAPQDVGLTIYNTTKNVHEYWNGSCWLPVGTTICTDFNLSTNPGAGCIYTSSASTTVTDLTVNLVSGVVVPVMLSAANVPAGVTVNFSSGVVLPTSTVQVSFTGSATATPGTVPILLIGVFGSIVQIDTFMLTVVPGTISISQDTGYVNEINVAPNTTTTSTQINVNFNGGCSACNQAVLSVIGTPAGVTPTFSSATIPTTNGSSTLTFTSNSCSDVGTYNLTIAINLCGQVVTFPYTLVIDTSVIEVVANATNQNIYVAAGTPACPVTLIYHINPNVVISSTSTATPALTTGSFPNGGYIGIQVDCGGGIVGKGGNGGHSDNQSVNILNPNSCQAIDGTPGGPALTINCTGVYVINPCGLVGGGGGGGGSGEDMTYAALCGNLVGYKAGGGGGGGTSQGLGGIVPAGSSTGAGNGQNGGTLPLIGSAGGNGGGGGNYNCTLNLLFFSFNFNGTAGAGGAGGGYGQPGNNGGGTNCSGDGVCGSAAGISGCPSGSGGAAGPAIKSNSNTFYYIGQTGLTIPILNGVGAIIDPGFAGAIVP